MLTLKSLNGHALKFGLNVHVSLRSSNKHNLNHKSNRKKIIYFIQHHTIIITMQLYLASTSPFKVSRLFPTSIISNLACLRLGQVFY